MSEVHALIVGVGHYPEFGNTSDVPSACWNALSAARWALRLTRPERVYAFIDPGPNPHQDLAREIQDLATAGVSIRRECTFHAIHTFCMKSLPKDRPASSRLIIYWSGHAFVHTNDSRMFICRDYNPVTARNDVFNFTRQLRFLRSPMFASFTEQFILADVCAQYDNKFSPLTDDPEKLIPGIAQTAFFATPLGKYAPAECDKAGPFTTEAMKVLQGDERWPDCDTFKSRLFSALEKYNQTPFMVSGHDGREEVLGQVFPKPGVPSASLDLTRPLILTKATMQEKFDARRIRSLAFHPTGESMVYSKDCRMFVLPLTRRCFPTRFGFPGSEAADAARYAAKEEPHTVRPSDAHAGASFATMTHRDEHLYTVTDIAFSPDEGLLASADYDGVLKLWDYTTRTCRAENKKHASGITSIAFSPKGDMIASASWDEWVYVWHVKDLLNGASKPYREFGKESAKKGRPRPLHDRDAVQVIAFSQDGLHLATGDQKGLIEVREIRTRDIAYRHQIHYAHITGLRFCPSPTNGLLLATASDDTRVCLVDCSGGKSIVTLGVGKGRGKHTAALTSIAFSPHGDVLISASADGFVKLWDVTRMKLLHTCEKTAKGHITNRVAFVPNSYDFGTNAFKKDVSLWTISNAGDIENTIVRHLD